MAKVLPTSLSFLLLLSASACVPDRKSDDPVPEVTPTEEADDDAAPSDPLSSSGGNSSDGAGSAAEDDAGASDKPDPSNDRTGENAGDAEGKDDVNGAGNGVGANEKAPDSTSPVPPQDVSRVPSGDVAVTEEAPNVQVCPMMYVVHSANVSVREAPAPQAPSLTTLPPGASVETTRASEGYVGVKVPGGAGFIDLNYLNCQKTARNPDVASAPRPPAQPESPSSASSAAAKPANRICR